MNWYLKVLKQFADFSGRARRKEYWMFALFNFIISIVLGIIDSFAGLYIGPAEMGIGVLSSIYSLAVLIPALAVTVRRLHDVGKSGWFILIALIPIVGSIILLVKTVTEGEHADNAWGPDPKAGELAF